MGICCQSEALISKEWNPGNWNGDMWADPNASGDMGKVFFTSDTVLSPFPTHSAPNNHLWNRILSEQVNPSLLEEPITISPEVVTLQSTVDSLKTWPYLCF